MPSKLVASFVFLVLASGGLSHHHEFESTLQTRNVQYATYKLHTRDNIYNGETVITGDKTRLLAAGFKESRPMVMLTHGFNDDADDYLLHDIKTEILTLEDINVIMVDWSGCSKNLVYNEVVECMKQAGLETGGFLKFLRTAVSYNLERVHLIGHSLGAHLMAFAGKVFPERTIGRITGLDPAGPLFEHAPETDRLNGTSAKLVDVIHTCRIFLGMKKPIGTVDFYPNGGYNQTGCDKLNLRCHHTKSLIYFAKTITRPYPAKKCDSLENAMSEKCTGEEAMMGYNIEYRTPGIYYTRIN